MTNPHATITHISWGQMRVDVGGQTRAFKDCKVWPGGAVEWDWNLTGTHHEPGIQPADVEEILQHDVDVLILSRGMQRRLQTAPETEQLLRERGIDYHIAETNDAVDLFNDLARRGQRVGGVFHSTC